MRNPAEAVETLQPEILHVPINSSKASVLPEALHDTPIPTPLGESWTGPPLSRQEVESHLQQPAVPTVEDLGADDAGTRRPLSCFP